MSKRLSLQNWKSEEDLRESEGYGYIAHSDIYSVFFTLEENAKLYKENLDGSKSTSEAPKICDKSNSCNCEKYICIRINQKSELVTECGNNFVREIFGSICNPPKWMYFGQGYPNDYYTSFKENKNINFIRGCSSSFYLTIYDHILSSHKERNSNVNRALVVPSILRFDCTQNNFLRCFRFEHIDYGALFYREFFYGKDHTNFFGIDSIYGPFVISIKREMFERKINIPDIYLDNEYDKKIKTYNTQQPINTVNNNIKYNNFSDTYYICYRIIARFISTYNLRIVIPELKQGDTKTEQKFSSYKDIVKIVLPKLSTKVSVLPSTKNIEDEIIKFDEKQALSQTHKVGILYCAPDQDNETDMYCNSYGDSIYEAFLNLIGSKVVLEGFTGYPGMLDTKNNLNGTHSIYTKFHNREIMFHVATLMPHDPTNNQQIAKKRYLGNDMVTVIFQHANAPPFSPRTFKSQFQNALIIVRGFVKDKKIFYKVAIFRQSDCPYFGPVISEEYYPHSEYFRQFILTKIINAEYATLKTYKFAKYATRTRYNSLLEFRNHIPNFTSDKAKVFTDLFRSNLPKKLSKSNKTNIYCYYSDSAITWSGQIYYKINDIWLNCVVCLSAFSLSIVCKVSKQNIINVLSPYIVAFRINKDKSVRIYHRAGNSIYLRLCGKDETKVNEFIARLKLVSDVVEAIVVPYIPISSSICDLVVDDRAIVKSMSPSNFFLKTIEIGDQILEIENIQLNSLNRERFYKILCEGGEKRLLIARRRKSEKNERFVMEKEEVDNLKFDKENNPRLSHSAESLFDEDEIEMNDDESNIQLASTFFTIEPTTNKPRSSSCCWNNQNLLQPSSSSNLLNVNKPEEYNACTAIFSMDQTIYAPVRKSSLTLDISLRPHDRLIID